MKTYIQQCKENLIELNEDSFNKFVDFWSKSDQTRNVTLNEAIGISIEDYKKSGSDFNKVREILKNNI